MAEDHGVLSTVSSNWRDVSSQQRAQPTPLGGLNCMRRKALKRQPTGLNRRTGSSDELARPFLRLASDIWGCSMCHHGNRDESASKNVQWWVAWMGCRVSHAIMPFSGFKRTSHAFHLI